MPVTRTLAGAALAALGLLTAAPSARVAARDLRWAPAVDGRLARELNGYARRGFRLAAISDGLPCEIAAVQAQDGPPRAFEYRLVPARGIPADLAALVADGWVPRGTTHGAVPDAVVLERATPRETSGAWRVVEFESYSTLARALAPAAAEGFRPRLVLRQPFGGLFGRGRTTGVVAAARAEGADPREVTVLSGAKGDLEDLGAPVAEATRAGWQFDLVQTPRTTPDRRTVAHVVLSRTRAGAAAARAGDVVTVSTPSIALGVGRVLGIAPYQDRYVTATVPVDLASGVTTTERAWLGPSDATCPPVGGFRDFHPPRRAGDDVVAVVARPSDRQGGGYDVLVVMQAPGARP
ncbi:MAG: hypothetical protein R2745_00795 [Vicinamibacterales bacterium]